MAYLTELKRQNRNFSYLLAVVDCFTRKAYVRSAKTLKTEEITTLFEDILRKENPNPSVKALVTDRGNEFASGMFQQMLASNNIEHSFATNTQFKVSFYFYFIKTKKQQLFHALCIVHKHEKAPGALISSY